MEMKNIMDNPNTEVESITVPLSQLRHFTDRMSQFNDDMPITLELVLTALFPTVWKNIQKWGCDQFMAGYFQGRKDEKDEDKGIS